MNENLPAEVGRSYLLSRREKSRTANWQESVPEKRRGDAVLRHRGRYANRDIRVARSQVHHRIGTDHFERYVRTAFSPARKERYEPTTGTCVRRCHAQRLSLGDALCRSEGGRKVVEAVADDGKQAQPRVGQGQGPGLTSKERMSAVVLELPDLMADSGRRDVELGRRALETHVARCRLKAA